MGKWGKFREKLFIVRAQGSLFAVRGKFKKWYLNSLDSDLFENMKHD